MILLEEAIGILDSKALNLRLVEIIKLININEISFIPKLKAICVICKNFDEITLVEKLKYDQIISDFRGYLIQPPANCVISNRIGVEQYNEVMTNYLYNLEQIFVSLYYFLMKFNNDKNNLRNIIF